MNYLHHPYAYAGHATVPLDQPMGYDPSTMAHPSMVHPMDGYLYPHPPFEMVDFYHQPIMDYEEYAENLSRPRLTKEQVETLEAQFQAHPKPSSNVKRQLAAQTNLSLPRVANWFQNRRAKAKQQRRQEEFERMQKAKAEAEEAARGKSDNADNSSESSQNNQTPKQESDDADTPKQLSSMSISGDETKGPAPSSSRAKHQKSGSQSAREATFASLQRALNAAVAAREQYGDDECGRGDTSSMEGSLSPTSTTYQTNTKTNIHDDIKHGQSALNTSFVGWTSSQSTQEHLGYSGLISSQHQSASQTEEWASQSTESLPSNSAASDAEASYTAMQYSLQPEMSLSRRGSSDDLAATLQGIGIDTGSGHNSWREAGKELDLAARRKRPRPAAIGTSRSSNMLAASSSSSLSPTTRLPGYGAGHSVRQSKSAQCLNTRFAGVRKASTAQRSPLNMSNFAEAGALSSSKAEMSTMLQPTVTNGLAPPTPLTPEDLQHLLPTSPSDGGYCLSAQPTCQLFPTTQSMQISIASPPATPLAVDMVPSYSYQHVAPPMSAPAHFTSFPDYISCEGGPLTGRSWVDATSMPSPEQSFQSRCPLPAQTDISSMSYEQAVDHSMSDNMQGSTDPSADDAKRTEFYICEFPEQQEAHRFVAQQLPTQKSKVYTFADNTTPTNFNN